MDRDRKIEKINAYNKLLGTHIKSVTKDETLQSEIQAEFTTFVNQRLEALMGSQESIHDSDEKASYRRLTSLEVDILKDFVARTLARSSDQEKQATAPQQSQALANARPLSAAAQRAQKEQQNAPTPGKALINPVIPKGVRMTARDVSRYANDATAYARALEQMDGFDPDAPAE